MQVANLFGCLFDDAFLFRSYVRENRFRFDDSFDIWFLIGGLGLLSTGGMGGNARVFGKGGITGGGGGCVLPLALMVSGEFIGGGTCVLLGTAGGRNGTGGGI